MNYNVIDCNIDSVVIDDLNLSASVVTVIFVEGSKTYKTEVYKITKENYSDFINQIKIANNTNLMTDLPYFENGIFYFSKLETKGNVIFDIDIVNKLNVTYKHKIQKNTSYLEVKFSDGVNEFNLYNIQDYTFSDDGGSITFFVTNFNGDITPSLVGTDISNYELTRNGESFILTCNRNENPIEYNDCLIDFSNGCSSLSLSLKQNKRVYDYCLIAKLSNSSINTCGVDEYEEIEYTATNVNLKALLLRMVSYSKNCILMKYMTHLKNIQLKKQISFLMAI